MSRILAYLFLSGAAAYASQAMCPCSTSARRVHNVRSGTTVHRVSTATNSADRSANRDYSTTTMRSIVLPTGTPIPVRLEQPLDTKHDRAGAPFVASVSSAVVRDGEVILPRGTICRGHLFESKPSGRLKGRAVMGLTLDSVELRGRVYHVVSSGPVLAGKNHKKHDAAWIGGGAGTGAAIGAIAGGGVGAAIGAGAGAVAGTTGAVITGKKNLHLAPETRMTFTLRQPVAVRDVELRASR